MPSPIQKKYYNSAKVFWLNRNLLIDNLNRCIENLVNKRPEVKKVILFGSFVENKSLPSFDLDLILIVSGSEDRFIDRFPIYIDFFEDLGIGTDILVYTEKEVASGTIPLVETALKKGKVLFER